MRQPTVAVAALLIDKHGRLLISRRRSKEMHGRYGAPGGRLEWMETFTAGACRELKEETRLEALEGDCEILGVDQGFHPEEDNCWVIIFVRVSKWKGNPRNSEPDKHGPWEWHPLDKLPPKTFRPLRDMASKLLARTTNA